MGPMAHVMVATPHGHEAISGSTFLGRRVIFSVHHHVVVMGRVGVRMVRMRRGMVGRVVRRVVCVLSSIARLLLLLVDHGVTVVVVVAMSRMVVGVHVAMEASSSMSAATVTSPTTRVMMARA